MKENYKYGWVGLYRSLKSHWIYPSGRPFTKYEAWIDLLLMVNHEDKEVFAGEDLVECKRGETVTSQRKLMTRWSWSKSKLLKFLEILKKDSMIDFKSDSKKTTLKVLNYVDYQDFEEIGKIKKDHKKTVERLEKDLRETTERLQKATNNKENKENNDNKEIVIEITKEDNSKKKSLFSNSGLNNEEIFKQAFRAEEEMGIDVLYYKAAVSDWSDIKGTTRTVRGWIATVRGFMRRDKTDDKLQMTNSHSLGIYNLEP